MFRTVVTTTWLAALLSPAAHAVDSLNVMSFNVWTAEDSRAGRDGIVAAVLAGEADLVGFQEMGGRAGSTIATTLGMNYDFESMIASRYSIVDTTFTYGVKLELEPGEEAYAFNVHLHHEPYGPYQLNGLEYFGGALYDPSNAADIEAVVRDQIAARDGVLTSVLNEMQTALSSGLPVFLTGDFNEASHLDWTQAAMTAGVHNAVVPWPASIKVENAGLIDSYREVYPNEVTAPGNTWSPVFGPDYLYQGGPNDGLLEPQDRIDFVHYAGIGVSATGSSTVGPEDGISDIGLAAGFPSDHRAVVTSFALVPEPSSLVLASLVAGLFVWPSRFGRLG